jgi:hypothetical protein
MSLLAKKVVLCAGLALAGGCSSKSLRPDAGGDGTIGGASGTMGGAVGSIGGAGGAIIDGGATDGAGGAPFAGRRSFAVTSTLRVPSGSPTGAPTSHVFTMVVDGDNGTAILGAYGQVSVSPIEPVAGGFRVTASPGFPAAVGSVWSVRYVDLTFVLDPAGLLAGSGSGMLSASAGGGCNMNYDGLATMSLTGAPDTVAPVLAFTTSADLADPFTSFSIVSSEPLPEQTEIPALRAAGGDTVVLTPSFTNPDTALSVFSKPSIVLRFGEQYRIDLSGTSDFAGNAAVGTDAAGLGFMTVAAPPLVAADGFESVTTTTLGGAQVLSDAGDPIINGTRSLYIPPAVTPATLATETQLALRLAAGPGKTVLRFAYRIVNPDATFSPYWVVGSVGGSIGGASLPAGNGATTVATIGGTQVTLGPMATAAIDLPADATDEIILERIAPQSSCKAFPIATTGVIIDDLRVE